MRWEVDQSHPYYEHGIDEFMSIDHNKHSLFGVSKAAADLMVQEYGRYFDLKTACLPRRLSDGTCSFWNPAPWLLVLSGEMRRD